MGVKAVDAPAMPGDGTWMVEPEQALARWESNQWDGFQYPHRWWIRSHVRLPEGEASTVDCMK